jgi:hypothetical protein
MIYGHQHNPKISWYRRFKRRRELKRTFKTVGIVKLEPVNTKIAPKPWEYASKK